MLTEFVSIQLSREELKELHAALLQKAIVEDEVRQERGQERVERRGLLERLEMLLGEGEDRLQELDRETEDELWEYAWYAYTDEWAWYRAAQDVEAEAGKTLEKAEFTKRVELLYQKKFNEYIAEIDMHEAAKKPRVPKTQKRTS